MAIPYVIFTDLNTNVQYNSYSTYGLILSNQDIGFPALRKDSLEIPGSHGVLDLTEIFGKVYYKNRTITLTFNVVINPFAWDELRTRIAGDLHGKRLRIKIWSDPEYVYVGRCEIDKYQSSKGLGTIVIKCDCEPFKEQIMDSSDYEFFTVTPTQPWEKTFEITNIFSNISILHPTGTGENPFSVTLNQSTTFNIGEGMMYSQVLYSGTYTIKITSETEQRLAFGNQRIAI